MMNIVVGLESTESSLALHGVCFGILSGVWYWIWCL